MKNTIILVAAILIAQGSIYAQDETREINSLFHSQQSLGVYIGMGGRVTQVNHQDALLIGGEVAFEINRCLNLGIEGYGMASEVYSNNYNEDGDRTYYQMGYGGLHLEPVIASERILHLTLPILIGAGGIAETEGALYTQDPSTPEHFDPPYESFDPVIQSDYFFFAEPGAQLEVNLFKHLRLGAGMSYRFTSEPSIIGLQKSDLEGWNAQVSLRLGWF